MRIGILGSGNMGAALGRSLAANGHTVGFSFSRDPAKLARLARASGSRAFTDSPREVARRSRVVVLYLTGSLAAGDFDRNSDVDFVVVTENEVGGELFSSLDILHRRVAMIDSWCATQLDGTYISRRALRRFDPANAIHANIDRGRGERLKMVQYDQGVVQSYLLRERVAGRRTKRHGKKYTA